VALCRLNLLIRLPICATVYFLFDVGDATGVEKDGKPVSVKEFKQTIAFLVVAVEVFVQIVMGHAINMPSGNSSRFLFQIMQNTESFTLVFMAWQDQDPITVVLVGFWLAWASLSLLLDETDVFRRCLTVLARVFKLQQRNDKLLPLSKEASHVTSTKLPSPDPVSDQLPSAAPTLAKAPDTDKRAFHSFLLFFMIALDVACLTLSYLTLLLEVNRPQQVIILFSMSANLLSLNYSRIIFTPTVTGSSISKWGAFFQTILVLCSFVFLFGMGKMADRKESDAFQGYRDAFFVAVGLAALFFLGTLLYHPVARNKQVAVCASLEVSTQDPKNDPQFDEFQVPIPESDAVDE